MKNKQLMKNRRSRILLIGALVLILTCALSGAALASRRTAERQSLYVTMKDGTQIAIDLWLPADLKPGEKIPAMLRSTCYWRSYQMESVGQFMEDYALMPGGFSEPQQWVEAGYALVLVDVRGTGASYGEWSILWSDQEIADLGEVVDWIITQPWSNGKVGAYGVSYDGSTAEQMSMLNHPALKAVAPQSNELDLYTDLAFPGGVMNEKFIKEWSEFHELLGANDVCGIAKAAKMDCEQMKSLMSGVRQVDDDLDGEQVAAAVGGHKHVDVYEWGKQLEFHDDLWGDTGLQFVSTSPYARRAAIERANLPTYVWVSWLDGAMADAALKRYLTFDNPQTVIIGPWSHGAMYHADPFLPADAAVEPSPAEQFDMLTAFFDAYLKDDGAAAPETGITYYTLGAGTWNTTRVWPPEGVVPVKWFFGEDQGLVPSPPANGSGSDSYTVDWTASTGELNRWYTGLFKDDVVYPDRLEEDKKLLTYTSASVQEDVEITGNPVVTLYVSSTTPDAAFHVYLEDVAPDGKVTYLTEGMLRAVNRNVSDEEPPYAQFGPYHSLERLDSLPMVPGEAAEISFHLYATSVLIEQGHQIRVAIAGHDASMFMRYPKDDTPVFTVFHNSYIELPIRPR
ncbi:MAG: CocE/NonD family hydrolase [Chloroflexi bacterium]|nr:MAG: CocE/NonD family hydrolase [Chloroflexota bacterium]